MKNPAFPIAFVIALGLGTLGEAADPPSVVTAQIEALIKDVEGLDGAFFIRNGSDYDAKTAGKFLRGKWGSHKKEIDTAADFIEKAASVSSTTGKPYLIRFKDGSQVRCGDYLKAKLEKLQAARPAKP